MTITVAQMIEALNRLPQDAKLVMTESGYYADGDIAEIMLPEVYTVKSVQDPEFVRGETVYRIGHSHQSY